jgi:glycosyltransferase involved in cell wall biosynthesis
MRIAAYIPCYNNQHTLAEAIQSVQSQTLAIDDLFVVDDGSTDESASVAIALGVEVLRQEANSGRGAARSRAMQRARHDLVLCCDATNVLAPDFCARAFSWFEDAKVAAVFGRISQRPGGDAVTRWRGRYLFQMPDPCTAPKTATRDSSFATYGAMVRRTAVMEVGNFDARLRHSEDAELGRRLLANQWDVVQDPALVSISIVRNSLSQVLERYWRWNAGAEEAISWSGYVRLISYAVKSMAMSDLKDRDLGRALISLCCPHYQFWRSRLRHSLQRVQR